MARRSSARLRDKASTPKRVSLSHDAPTTTTRTPRTAPHKLSSLQESDEMPGAFPDSPSLHETKTCTKTPTKASIEPADEEMHPQLHHQTTAKPREEARHLGFSNMAPHTEPSKQKSKIAMLQATPSKTRDLESDVKSPNFQFTFRREHSLELSPEAKKLMQEQREKAAKIREQMMAEGEAMPPIDEMVSRKIAKPKGRFSQVHLKAFEKMDSIAGHASAYRNKTSAGASSSTSSTERVPLKEEGASAKSLKRSPSKAELDTSSTPPRPSSRDALKPLPAIPGSSLPRSKATHDLTKPASSPAKRVKRVEAEDVSATRPSSSDGEQSQGTPRKYPDLSHLTTPTQSSLARASSVKSVKTGSKIPGPSFTPAKNAPASILKHASRPAEHSNSPALLAKSPSKPSFFNRDHGDQHVEKTASRTSPLLARSPVKAAATKPSPDLNQHESGPQAKAAPLLSRSPVKAGATKDSAHEENQEKKIPAIPFLARSPTKLPVSANIEASETPGKSTSSKLFGRFNLLRQSPMKSILRSPQRLYSDDPAKVAAGTHLATPPKLVANTNKALPSIPNSRAATPATQKHVDFSSSTKARDLKVNSSTPSHSPSPAPPRNVTMSVEPEPVGYPDLSEEPAILSPSPQKRRQTSGPGDFTFRAGSQDIVFGQPQPQTAPRTSTIRMVDYAASPAPATGSKKRKFEFENHAAAVEKDATVFSDKENTPAAEEETDDRAAKRVKTNPSPVKKGAAAPTANSTARRTTLGVKPKGARGGSPVKKAATTISQSRLAALAQPKKRG